MRNEHREIRVDKKKDSEETNAFKKTENLKRSKKIKEIKSNLS